jgi:hypothetical protein
MSGKPLAEQEIGMALLADMVAYAETSISRTKIYPSLFWRSSLTMRPETEELWMTTCVFQKSKFEAKNALSALAFKSGSRNQRNLQVERVG